MASTPETRPIYSELDGTRFCIRVLKLLPLLKGAIDAIQCTLFTQYFDTLDWTEYEALSYTWGEATDDFPITVNGQPFRVRKNLLSAMQHLRYEHEPRLLWIGA